MFALFSESFFFTVHTESDILEVGKWTSSIYFCACWNTWYREKEDALKF